MPTLRSRSRGRVLRLMTQAGTKQTASQSAPMTEALEFETLDASQARSLTKYVFIQNDPFYLPRVLDKYLREYSDSTAGINIQSVAQGKRTIFRTAMDLLRMYGPWYFQWKLRKYIGRKLMAKIVNDIMGSTRRCFSVRSVAKKYNVAVHDVPDVNSDAFLAMLRELGVELIVSISGTQMYRKQLRSQTKYGIVNCHGALLPRFRGLMPSFWTLAQGEREGGVTVHYVDAKLDNGPIIVQRTYRIHDHDTLEDIMTRSKDLAAECIIEAVHVIEQGDPKLMSNRARDATHFSMPTKDDVKKFRAAGHRFF